MNTKRNVDLTFLRKRTGATSAAAFAVGAVQAVAFWLRSSASKAASAATTPLVGWVASPAAGLRSAFRKSILPLSFGALRHVIRAGGSGRPQHRLCRLALPNNSLVRTRVGLACFSGVGAGAAQLHRWA